MAGARALKVILLTLVTAVLFSSTLAFAQSGSPKGINVSPTLQQIIISPKEDAKQVELTVGNNTDAPQTFAVSAVDFGTLGDGGGVAFEGQKDLVLKDQHRLAAWINIPQKEITVPASQSAKVQFTIRNDEKLVPGGHYGAILLRPITQPGQNGRARVEVSQVASSLLFVRKIGGEKESLDVDSFKAEGHWWRLPESSQITFNNTGNVHIVPRGSLTLTAPNGTVISEGIMNSQSSLVLPDAKRTITTQLDKRSRAWMPGFYTLSVQYRPENSETPQTLTMKYFYIGNIAAGLIIMFLLMIVGSIFGWKIWRKKRQ